MNYRYSKKIISFLTIIICCTLVISGCKASVQKPEFETSFKLNDKALIETMVSRGEHSASSEDISKMKADMKLLLENEKTALYIGEYYDIAVFDKRAESIFYSNRKLHENLDTPLTKEQKERSYSQISLSYYRSNAQEGRVYSFPECFDGEKKNQVKVEVKDKTAFITYQFGTRVEDKILISAFSADTYKIIEEKAESLRESGELSRSDWGRFKSTYNHLVYNALSADDQKNYSAQYANFEKLGEIYVLNPSATYIQIDAVEKVSDTVGLTREDVKKEEETVGGGANLASVVPPFEITVEYRLHGADFIATVDPAKIKEPDGAYLNKIYLLPGFGATDRTEEGYLFISGGSGSIISNSQNASGVDNYDVSFYGSDYALDIIAKNQVSEVAPFPVFGLKRGKKSVFAVAESGEAMGGTTAQLSGVLNVENQVMPWFVYRQRSAINTGNKGREASADFVYSKNTPTIPYSIRYHFLYNDKSDYSGMADYYRTYLTQTDSFKSAETASNITDIELIGAINIQKMKMGIPMKVVSPLSSYEEATNFINRLYDKNIPNISLRYTGIMNGGLEHKAPFKAKMEKSIGSIDDFKAMAKNLEAKNISVYPNVDFMRIYQEGNGLNINRDLTRALNKIYAVESNFDPATDGRGFSISPLLVDPLRFNAIIDSFSSSYEKLENNTIYAASIGRLLYSSYSNKREITREESKQLSALALKTLKEKGYHLQLDTGNAYALPYAKNLVNVPITASDNRMLTHSIPFVGMVFSGRIGFSGEALNRVGNYDVMLLKTIESGAGISLQLATGDIKQFAESFQTEFYSLSADKWFEEILNINENFKELNEKTAGKTIERHDILASGLVKLQYSGGTSILLNYNDSLMAYEDYFVDGLSYKMID